MIRGGRGRNRGRGRMDMGMDDDHNADMDNGVNSIFKSIKQISYSVHTQVSARCNADIKMDVSLSCRDNSDIICQLLSFL